MLQGCNTASVDKNQPLISGFLAQKSKFWLLKRVHQNPETVQQTTFEKPVLNLTYLDKLEKWRDLKTVHRTFPIHSSPDKLTKHA